MNSARGNSAADPPDDRERARNENVFVLHQQNRSPYVDRPAFVNLAFAPVLQIGCVSTNLWLQWSADFSGAAPETAPSIIGPWTALTNAPVRTNAHWRVVLPRKASRGFYRLQVKRISTACVPRQAERRIAHPQNGVS